MTSKEKYSYWLQLVNYDLDTTKALIDAEKWTYVAVLCQQAAERLVKGMFVYHTNREAPKSHNVMFLINKMSINEKFLQSPESARFIEEKEKYEDFILDLMYYYINDYPFSYKKVMDRFIKKEVALEIYENTLKLVDWLKGFQES